MGREINNNKKTGGCVRSTEYPFRQSERVLVEPHFEKYDDLFMALPSS